MKKIVFVLAAALLLTGCQNIKNEKIDDIQETNETEERTSESHPEYYDMLEEGGILRSVEKVGDKIKYAIINDITPIPVEDGEACLNLQYSANYTNNGVSVESSNTTVILLYHNGFFQLFDIKDTETDMYSVKTDNNKIIEENISFKVDGKDNEYILISMSRNDNYKKNDFGEYVPAGVMGVFGNVFLTETCGESDIDDKIIPYSEECIIENCDKDKFDKTNAGQEILEKKLLEYGLNSIDEFIYKKDENKYCYAAIRCDKEPEEKNNEYLVALICDDKLYSGFGGKPTLKYTIDGSGCVSCDVDLSGLDAGEHIIYTITVDKTEKRILRSRYTNIVIGEGK